VLRRHGAAAWSCHGTLRRARGISPMIIAWPSLGDGGGVVPNLAAPSRTVPDQAGCQDPLTPAEQGRSGVGGSSRTDPSEAHPAERSMLPCALGALALPMRRSILGVMQFFLVRSGTGGDRP
jgi:hypothetical protein